MLSRVAKGLFDLGRSVERAQHVAQILEVNHKMNLERAANDEADVWRAISNAFECKVDLPNERNLYERLVLSTEHPYSVRYCIGQARFEGRALREHISEEMWLHLNHTYLAFEKLSFEEILSMGRSEFNQRIRIFSDALGGLSDDTMIRGEAWGFLKVGKQCERSSMISRVLKIKEGSITPEHDGAPVDVHQWQALLRSLSGYEPYRRAYDARIIPSRVLDFVLRQEDFPRSLAACLREMRSALRIITNRNAIPSELEHLITGLLDELRRTRAEELLASGGVPLYLERIDQVCVRMAKATQRTFFASMRPAAPTPSIATQFAGSVAQQ